MGSTLSRIIPLDAFIELELVSSINDFMDAMDIKMEIEDAKKKLKKAVLESGNTGSGDRDA